MTAHPLLDTLCDMNVDNPLSYLGYFGRDECHELLLKVAWTHCQDGWDVVDMRIPERIWCCRSRAGG